MCGFCTQGRKDKQHTRADASIGNWNMYMYRPTVYLECSTHGLNKRDWRWKPMHFPCERRQKEAPAMDGSNWNSHLLQLSTVTSSPGSYSLSWLWNRSSPRDRKSRPNTVHNQLMSAEHVHVGYYNISSSRCQHRCYVALHKINHKSHLASRLIFNWHVWCLF